MSFPGYADYRDAEAEWLPRLPTHWRLASLRWLSRRFSGGTPDKNSPEYWENGTIPWLNSGEVNQGLITAPSTFISDAGFANSSAKWIPAGALVMALAGQGKTKGMVAQLAFPATCNQSMAAIVPSAEVNARFLYWWLQSNYQNIRNMAGGDLRDGLNLDLLGEIPCPLPSSAEQSGIAAFLDRETAKIDALVEEQKRLIELLKEKRQAVISQAVTKGLDPSVPMKDSGVAWLGEVPAHWVVMPIRVAARLESGHTPSRSRPDWWENCTVPWFTLADVWQIRQGADVIYETEEKVSELGLANSSARRLPKGTVMLSRTASVGFSAIMGTDMATTQDFANWVCGDKVLPEFLLCVFRSMSGEFRRLMMGSTHNTIYMPDIQALRFALPPIPEQRNIVEHVRKAVASFDGLTNEAQRGVDLLTERRSALISAAVTGKIDVRGLAPRPEVIAA